MRKDGETYIVRYWPLYAKYAIAALKSWTRNKDLNFGAADEKAMGKAIREG